MEKAKVKKSRGKFSEVLPVGGAGEMRLRLLPSWEYLGRFFSIFRALPTAEIIKQPLGPSSGRYFPLGVAVGKDFMGSPHGQFVTNKGDRRQAIG